MKVILVARKAFGVFDQLAGAAADEQDRRFVEVERAIHAAHHPLCALVIGADDDTVGALEVADRGTFAQEFGVGDDLDIDLGALLPQDRLYLVPGADGDGRLGDDDSRAGHRRGNLLGRGEDVAKDGMAIAAARGRADRDKDRIGARHGRSQIGGEGQSACRHVARDQRIETRLVDRHPPRLQRGDLALVLVDADHLMPEIGKAGTRYQADIARTDHRNAHRYLVVEG